MSISQALDVAIGLIVVYYLLGSIVSLITQMVNEIFETRGAALEQYLTRLVGDKKIGDLISLPQVQALRPIRYKGVLSVFSAATEPKKLEKIPVATLVDSFFDLAGLTANKEMELLQLAETIDKLPDSEAKQAFISWINQGVTNIADLRTRATAYFGGVMDQAAATFRARARSFVILLSILITLLFGTDSIQLIQTLWSSATLRAIAAAQAQVIVQQEGMKTDTASIVDQLSAYSIKIGWWQTQELPDKTAPVSEWIWFVVLKVLGLSITAMAVSQGSSFWYDLLKKIVNPSKALGGTADAKG